MTLCRCNVVLFVLSIIILSTLSQNQNLYRSTFSHKGMKDMDTYVFWFSYPGTNASASFAAYIKVRMTYGHSFSINYGYSTIITKNECAATMDTEFVTLLNCKGGGDIWGQYSLSKTYPAIPGITMYCSGGGFPWAKTCDFEIEAYILPDYHPVPSSCSDANVYNAVDGCQIGLPKIYPNMTNNRDKTIKVV